MHQDTNLLLYFITTLLPVRPPRPRHQLLPHRDAPPAWHEHPPPCSRIPDQHKPSHRQMTCRHMCRHTSARTHLHTPHRYTNKTDNDQKLAPPMPCTSILTQDTPHNSLKLHLSCFFFASIMLENFVSDTDPGADAPPASRPRRARCTAS